MRFITLSLVYLILAISIPRKENIRPNIPARDGYELDYVPLVADLLRPVPVRDEVATTVPHT